MNGAFGVLAISLIGKLLGFLRIQMMAAVLGVSATADSVLLCLQVYSLWDVAIMSGGFAAVLLPRMVDIERRGAATRKYVFAGQVTFLCLLLAVVFAIAVTLGAPWLGRIAAPGLGEYGQRLFVVFCVAFSPLPVLMTVLVVYSLANRLAGRYMLFSSNPLIINGVSLLALWAAHRLGASAPHIATGYLTTVTAATAVMAFVQGFYLPNRDRRTLLCSSVRLVRAARGRLAQSLRAPMHMMISAVPLIGALFVQNAIVMVNYGFASLYGGEGAIATIGYAERLANVLFSVLVSALFIMLEPKWARDLSDFDRSGLPPKIADDVAGTIIACAPFALALAFAGSDIAHLVYGFGALRSIRHLDVLGQAVGYFGISVLPMTLSFCFSRILVILRETRAVIYANAMLLCVCPFLNYFCAKALGTAGVAASFAGLMVLQAFLYGWLLARHEGLDIAINSRTVKQILLVLLAILVALAVGSIAPVQGLQRVLLLATLSVVATAASAVIVDVDWVSRIRVRVGFHG